MSNNALFISNFHAFYQYTKTMFGDGHSSEIFSVK